MGYVERNCDNCNKKYFADTRNLNRGWGKCCNKKCAAELREKSKPSYDPDTVARNNRIRSGKMIPSDYEHISQSRKKFLNWKRFQVTAPNVGFGSGVVSGITSEGYRIMDGVAYDEWDEPVYTVDEYDDTHPFDIG